MRKILIFILCFCTIFLCFVIPSFADDSITPRSTPTDLSGYTVSVPFGWSATPRTNYSLVCQVVGGDVIYDSFRVGPGGDDEIRLVRSSDSTVRVLYPSESFSIVISGGGDVVNSSLIQWFVNNDATFTPASPPTSSISSGIYHFKESGFSSIPNASWSDGAGYTYSYTLSGTYTTSSRTIPFTAINVKFDEYVSSSYYTITFSVDTNDGIVDLATYSVSYGQVELEQRSDLKYLFFNEALVGSYDDIEFIRQFLVSGYPDVESSPTDNPWAYILEMIIEALQVDLFGYFSVWDIFTTICGIFIVTWLLKLLAGG